MPSGGSGSAVDGAIAGAQQFGLLGAFAGSAGANAIVGSLPASSSVTGANGNSPSLLAPFGPLGDLSGVFGGSAGAGGASGGGAGGNASGGGIDLSGLLSRLAPSGGLKTTLGDVTQGFGYGETAASLTGGNSTFGGIGGALGGIIGLAAHANPLIGAGIDVATGLLGSLFGNHTNAATSPDIYDTNNYNSIIAALTGKSGANGTTAYEDQATKNLFSGGDALGGVEKLLAGGQAAFAASTGIQDPALYAQLVSFFGTSATGAGTLDHGKNIGQLSVSGATGAGATESYTTVAQQLAQIEQGLSATGAGTLGAVNTYSIRRALPDYNLALQSGGTATQEALQSGSGPTGTVTGNRSGVIPITVDPVRRKATPDDAQVYVNASGSTFVGADGISGLTDLIQSALARKNSGQMPNPYGNAKRAVPV